MTDAPPAQDAASRQVAANMTNPIPTPLPGNWDATILLLCGASTMGKSHFVSAIFKPQYSAVCLRIDDVYTRAVTRAKMLKSSKAETKHAQQRDARRYARDRKWPSPQIKDAFFASYEAQVRKALQQARDARVPMVLEGGTLMKEDEVAIVAKCADDIFGKQARLVRVAVRVPYKRWLQNRVMRMEAAGLEDAPLRKLTNQAYRAEVKRAIPKPHDRLTDHVVKSPDEMRTLMSKLDRLAPATSR